MKEKLKTLERLVDQKISSMSDEAHETRTTKPEEMPPIRHDPKDRLVSPEEMNKRLR